MSRVTVVFARARTRTSRPSHQPFHSSTGTRSTATSAGEPDRTPTDLFRFTSGRWLYNERQRLDERTSPFNVEGLKRVAAAAVDCKIQDVRSLVKLAEGGFNRVLQVTMTDGQAVIARLPYKITQPKALAIASEVATMDFLRHYGLPIPRVYGYSADAGNPVGTEYILMEKVSGKPLGSTWFELSDKQRIKLLTEIVSNEVRLFELDLPAMGSIFYSKDLPHSMGRRHLVGPFCIGPDVALANWFDERSALDIPRNPAISTSEVLRQAAIKEIAFLQQFGRARFPFDRVYRDITNFEKSEPRHHLQNLQRFLQIIPHLVPVEPWLNRATLRHPDLNPNNIFVSEDMQITGIIDWQHAAVLPLFLCAGIPKHFANYGDPESEALNKPQPPDLEGLNDEECSGELELYRRRYLHFYYIGATSKMAKEHYRAITHDGGMFRQRIFRDARAPWEGNNVPLQADLVRLHESWRDLVPAPNDDSPAAKCPLSFTDEEIEWTLQALDRQMEADGQLRILQELGLGCGTDGWVPNEGYEAAKQKAISMKKTAIERADDESELEEIAKAWPFDDYDEDE